MKPRKPKKPRSRMANGLIGESITGYMDYVDFRYESGNPIKGNQFWADLDCLKNLKTCHTECGIVRVKITLDKWEELPTGNMAFRDTPSLKKKRRKISRTEINEINEAVKHNRNLLRAIFKFLSKRVSAVKIARTLGIKPSFVKYFESGSIPILFIHVQALARLLGMSVTQLILESQKEYVTCQQPEKKSKAGSKEPKIMGRLT